jgi:hypothetical protein
VNLVLRVSPVGPRRRLLTPTYKTNTIKIQSHTRVRVLARHSAGEKATLTTVDSLHRKLN